MGKVVFYFILFICSLQLKSQALEEGSLSEPIDNNHLQNHTHSVQNEDLAELTNSFWSQPSKRVIRKFAIDSPFGTLLGNSQDSQVISGTRFVEKNYRLLVCFTGVGLRIDL